MGFLGDVAAVVAANLITLAFVGAWLQAKRDKPFTHTSTTWAGLLMPLCFVVGVMIVTGGP